MARTKAKDNIEINAEYPKELEEKASEMKFSKEQILELEEYRYIKDVVSAVLEDKEYQIETAAKLIKSYLDKEVK